MSNRGHVPCRRCIVCRTVKPRQTLIRLADTASKVWRLDPVQQLGGRGYYICYSVACAQRLRKWKKSPLSAPVIDQIMNLIDKYAEGK